MIAGLAKVKLPDTLGDIHMLTPWVISGKNLTIASPEGIDGELALDSQAAFSWVMTKVEFEKGVHLWLVYSQMPFLKKINFHLIQIKR